MPCFFIGLDLGPCSGPVERGHCAGHRQQAIWRAQWDTRDGKPRHNDFLGNGPANIGQSISGRAA